MNIFVLKLILAPVILGGASLAGRRWGPAVSGWLVGLPLTSGPVIFFLALSQGSTFATSAIDGTVSGGFSLVAFCLVYAWLAIRFDWWIALSASLLTYFGIDAALQNIIIPFAPLIASVILTILLGLLLMPKSETMGSNDLEPGRRDILSRILIGTAFIVLLTEMAPILGSRLTGLLATIPLYTTILAVFAHCLQGPAGAAHVLRGLLLGLFGFAGFFLALSLLLERSGITIGFLAATAVALVIQGLTLLFIQTRNQGKEQTS
jgi:hypothetical protein